jgi:hypothetical protein
MRYYLISLFIVLTLVLSSSISMFVTGGGINAAYATKHSDSSSGDSKSGDGGGSSDSGGGGSGDDDTKKDKKSSKDSSSGSSGEESSPTTGNTDKKNNDNKDNNNSPSTAAPDNTVTGGDQNQGQAQTASPEEQQQQCPSGQHFDSTKNTCVSDTPPTSNNNPALGSALIKEAPLEQSPNKDGSCPPGYHLPFAFAGVCTRDVAPTTGETTTPSGGAGGAECPEGQHYDGPEFGCVGNSIPFSDKSCVAGYHYVNGICVHNGTPSSEQPSAKQTGGGGGGSGSTGTTTPTGGTAKTTTPTSGGAGGSQQLEGPDIGCIPGTSTCPKVSLPALPPPDECKEIPDLPYCKNPNPTTTPTATPPLKQTGGSTGTTAPAKGGTTTPTTTPPSSSTTTTVVNNNNNRGSQSTSSGGSSGASGGGSSTTQTSGINFLTYLNAPNKITIKYPSTWTKTESLGGSSIPVMFNAPTTDSTAAASGAPGAAPKTSFMIMINKLNPPTLTLDSYTQQQIDGLTHSNTVKYTITDTNAKVLRPPNGVSAYREISYDGLKSNNDVVVATATTSGGGGGDSSSSSNSQASIPLKGAAIFFVNGDTGYSLLYLAKQTDYVSSLPIIQQMINSFQIGAGSGNDNSSAGSSGGDVQSAASSSGQK